MSDAWRSDRRLGLVTASSSSNQARPLRLALPADHHGRAARHPRLGSTEWDCTPLPAADTSARNRTGQVQGEDASDGTLVLRLLASLVLLDTLRMIGTGSVPTEQILCSLTPD